MSVFTYSSYLPDPIHGLIPYKEAVGSLSSQYINNELVVKREFFTDWDLRWRFCRRMLGYHYLEAVNSSATSPNYIRRVIPHKYYPSGIDDYSSPQAGFRSMICSSIEGMDPIKPIEWNSDLREGVSTLAKCSFLYKYPLYAVYDDEEIRAMIAFGDPHADNIASVSDVHRKNSEVQFLSKIEPALGGITTDFHTVASKPTTILRYISKTVQPTAEHLILPYGCMRFVDGTQKSHKGKTFYGTKATSITTKLLSKTELIYTWHSVPTSDITGSSQVKKLQKYVGSVNQFFFDGYPPQTLLFNSINSRPFRQLGGHYTTDIEIRMTYFEVEEIYQGATGWIPFINGDDDTIGHNYFLRFSPDDLNMTEQDLADWLNLGYRYDLITHNGLATGRRLFQPRDFYELFVPA